MYSKWTSYEFHSIIKIFPLFLSIWRLWFIKKKKWTKNKMPMFVNASQFSIKWLKMLSKACESKRYLRFSILSWASVVIVNCEYKILIDIDVADPLEIWTIQNHLGKWQKEQYRGVKKRVLLAMRKREQSISFNWNDLIITTFKLKRNEVFVWNSKQ